MFKRGEVWVVKLWGGEITMTEEYIIYVNGEPAAKLKIRPMIKREIGSGWLIFKTKTPILVEPYEDEYELDIWVEPLSDGFHVDIIADRPMDIITDKGDVRWLRSNY